MIVVDDANDDEVATYEVVDCTQDDAEGSDAGVLESEDIQPFLDADAFSGQRGGVPPLL